MKPLIIKVRLLRPRPYSQHFVGPQNLASIADTFGTPSMKDKVEIRLFKTFQHEAKGSKFLHPFDDLDLIAGYGSLGLEILEDVPDVDIVLVCCGGGGLLAGVATSIKLFSKNPNVKVYGVEPENANGMFLSLKVCEFVNVL